MKEVGQAVMFAASLHRRRAAVAYNGYVSPSRSSPTCTPVRALTSKPG